MNLSFRDMARQRIHFVVGTALALALVPVIIAQKVRALEPEPILRPAPVSPAQATQAPPPASTGTSPARSHALSSVEPQGMPAWKVALDQGEERLKLKEL